MFTGIIKETGRVRNISGLGGLCQLCIESKDIVNRVAVGESVAVNGVCLTLTKKDKNALYFDVMGETAKRTNISRLKYADPVNLEDSLKASDSLSGHFVAGHIDCVGKIRDVSQEADNVAIRVVFPQDYKALVVEKGSIALDGVSLTVGKTAENSVLVYVIPHTLKGTTLGSKKTGDEVNIEFDIIGKYVANLVRSGRFNK